MKLVKTDLRNRIGEEYFNGALICVVEKEELLNVTNEVVRKRFFNMKECMNLIRTYFLNLFTSFNEIVYFS